MDPRCTVLCIAECFDLSFNNETLEALWTCLTFLCNVTVEDHQRTPFLSYLATNESADINASNQSNCTTQNAVLLTTVAGYAFPVKGCLSPAIILLTIINNTLVCNVLLKQHMRSPVNVILVLTALLDSLAFVFLVPAYIYFYATERVHEWVPYNWCYAINVMEFDMPILFFTASIWLTMVLAIQQYICVCHPFKARTWCTIRNVIYGFIAICLFATLVELPWFFNTYIIETRRRSRLNPSVMVSACIRSWSPVFAVKPRIYSIYCAFILIIKNLIPVVSIIVLNTLLIFNMRKTIKKRIKLLGQNKTIEVKNLKETDSTTMMLVTVMLIKLFWGIPIIVFQALLFAENAFDILIVTEETFDMFELFFNFCDLLIRPINIFIYCGMSKKFRDTFKRMVTCQELP